jgi:hypothetical protein
MSRPNVAASRDPGLLREALAEIYICDFVPLSTATPSAVDDR